MSDYLQTSIHFLECVLQNNNDYTAEGLSELYEIKNGNKEVILKHLKAINFIIEKSIKELEDN